MKDARLTFIFSSMNSGKSLEILTKEFMLTDKGFSVILMKPAVDDRTATISTRLGLERECILLEKTALPSAFVLKAKNKKPDFIIVDEAQFLTKEQVLDLANLVDRWGINIICYGLKLNWQGEFFEGSKELLIYADHLEQMDSYCKYNKTLPALFHIKLSGNFEDGGVETGYEEKYETVSRKKWLEWWETREKKQ